MADNLRALILGIVQGLTEFIPVSSSGHLILIPALFGWQDQGLAFDAGLHLGTLVAVVIYFWRDWVAMTRAVLADLLLHKAGVCAYRQESRLLLYIVAASVPVAVIGLLAADVVEENTRQPWSVAIALAVVAIAFLAVERVASRSRPMGSIRLADAMLIGLAQVAALFPGVSRSGATITMGMARGLEREAAARFAFLLGTPALVGAGLFALNDLRGGDGIQTDQFLIGATASAVVGLAAIHALLRSLRARSLAPFAYYRLAVAALTLVIGAARVA